MIYERRCTSGTYYVAVRAFGHGRSSAHLHAVGDRAGRERRTRRPTRTFPSPPPATAGRVEVGASATGNIGTSSDQDWFKRRCWRRASTYQIDHEGAPICRGTLTDPRLALFSGSGISLAINDDISSTNLISRIVRTATETGAHYLRAARSFGNTGTYTLSVHDITPPPSTDATLSALSVTGGGSELITDFASGTTNYPLSVANGFDEVTFAPTTNQAGTTVQYLGRGAVTLTDSDDMEDGFQLALDVGLNLLTLYVLAEDGTTIRVYYVNVTRAAACTLNEGDLLVRRGDGGRNRGQRKYIRSRVHRCHWYKRGHLCRRDGYPCRVQYLHVRRTICPSYRLVRWSCDLESER